MEALSIKKQIFYLVFSILLFIFFAVLISNFVQLQNRLNEYKQTSFDTIKTSYEKNVIKYMRDFYQNKIVHYITPEILEAVKNKDRMAIDILITQKFEMDKEEDEYLRQIHFHTSDGLTLYRAHRPDMYNDDIASVRPMAKKVHMEQSRLHGFEAGKNGLSFRVFEPIFYENEYLGSLELGALPTKILDVVSYFNDIDGLIYIEKSFLQENAQSIQKLRLKDKSLLAALPEDFDIENNFEFKHNGKNMIAFRFNILDYSGNEIGRFIFFGDLTSHYVSFKQRLISTISILALLFLSLYFIINYGFSKIIFELKNMNRSLRESIEENKRAEKLIQNYVSLIDQNIITSSTDLRGDITAVSTAFCDVSGYSKEELIGVNQNIVRHPDSSKQVFENMWSTIARDKVWNGEIKNLSKDGKEFWVYSSISPIFDLYDQKIGYIAIQQNVTDKKLVEKLSITDGLTNIYNRRYFNDELPKILNAAKRNDEMIALIALDVDFFKQYNDTYGHQKGDEVLIKIASTINDSLRRASDYCFRLGGEEFAVVHNVKSMEEAESLSHNLLDKIEDLEIEHSKSFISPYVTVSMGVVCKKAVNIKNMDEFYLEADRLLYDAKKNGRNTICMNDS